MCLSALLDKAMQQSRRAGFVYAARIQLVDWPSVHLYADESIEVNILSFY